jgi:hypothetical protein
VVEWVPSVRLALRIDDPGLPFSGSWTYSIQPDRDGSLLTVVERGAIKNTLFRSLARFVFGYHSMLDGYLRALGTRLGEETTPEHVQRIPPD